jgi:hypothetical protein
MKRLWIIGFGILNASWLLADQPLSVYPPEPRYIQLTSDEVKPEKKESVAPEKMPQPAPVAPTVNYPTYAPVTVWNSPTVPGTTIPAQATVGGDCKTCSTTACISCGVPCGTPLFSGICRPGHRPCLDQFSAWLGFRPGPRVMPTFIPNPVQQRPLHTYFSPTQMKTSCTTGDCAAPAATPPVFGFNLSAPTRPRGAVMPTAPLGHLGFGACATCKPSCGTPLFPQRCTTGCAAPGYLTPQGYPAARYAPAPSLFSRIFGFFAPQQAACGSCGTVAPTVMAGSSGTWSTQSNCANGGCAPAASQPVLAPQAVPQSAPQAMPAVNPQTSSVLPGYRFATRLTQIAPKPDAAPIQQVQHQKPVANQPFSNP